jgi:hypothetical protein
LFVIYTPHTINVQTSQGDQHAFPSQGIARVTEKQSVVGSESGIELRTTIYGEIEGLPEVKEGVFVIVSLLVRQVNTASPNPRKDLVSPDTGASCIRENGVIKSVTGFLF